MSFFLGFGMEGYYLYYRGPKLVSINEWEGGVEILKSRNPLPVEVWMFNYSFWFFRSVSF